MPRKKITRAEALALMANGVPLENAEAEAVNLENETEENAEPSAEEVTPVAEAPAEVVEPEMEAPQEKATDHTTTLLELTKNIAKLEMQVENLQAQLADAASASESAKTVIRTATERLGIGLGATVVGLDGLTLSGLCAQFNALNTKFEERHSVGPVSRVQATEDTEHHSNEVRRRIEASKISKGDK